MREVKRKYSYSQVRAPRRAAHRRRRLRAREVRRRHPRVPAVRPRPPVRRGEVAYARSQIAEASTRRSATRSFSAPARSATRRRLRRVQGAPRLRPRLPGREGDGAHARAPRRRDGAPGRARALRRALLPEEGQLRRRRSRASSTRSATSPGPLRAAPATAPTTRSSAEALLLLGETYLKMHKWADARDAFATIVQRYPETAARRSTRANYLDYMKEQGSS